MLYFALLVLIPISVSGFVQNVFYRGLGVRGISIETMSSAFFATAIDEEETAFLNRVKSNYLVNKFRDCRKSSSTAQDECRTLCTLSEIELLLRTILPPVSNKEMSEEIDFLLKKMPPKSVQSNSIDVDDFLNVVSENTFWAKAGDLVVKELIFFDCLHAYYYEKQILLSDDDYNELKEDLTWEGSVAVTMSGKEAHFVKAISMFQSKQRSILSDSEYDQLKSELSRAGSWVVNRVQDPLERMGVDTFMKYLHRAL